MKRIRMEVCPTNGGWKVTAGSIRVSDTLTQRKAIIEAVHYANHLVEQGARVTLKIKRPSGQIREERTYPRSSDPRRTKG